MAKSTGSGEAAERGNSALSSNAEARNSDGGGSERTATGAGGIRYGHGTYEGELTHGKPHGKGRLEYESGAFYEGEWKEGWYHGWGTYRWADGDVYEGEWVRGKEHGKGTTTSSSGESCEGDWKEGKQHGRGRVAYESGDVYVGEFENDKRHGTGTLTWTNGEVYDGQWVGGKQHGKGTQKLPTGEIYEGEFKDGERHGTGTTRYSSGRICTGEWFSGKRVCNQERTLRSQRSQQRRLEVAKKTCEHCGVDDVQYKLRACSGCNLALYCSAACQKAASGSHRRICDIVSMLPSRDSDRLVFEYDKDGLVDLDAGLRYATKYMDEMKHLQIDLAEMAEKDTIKLSAKQLSSLLRSKKGALDSVFWISNRNINVPGVSENGDEVWKELHGLKQLRLQCLKFDNVQHIHDIIGQQKDTLMVLSLPCLGIHWHKAKCRRSAALAVGSCNHLVKLELPGFSLMDSDLKVMLNDLPNLRVLSLLRRTDNAHEFTDNTCGLIARKCPGLQELNLRNHNHLSHAN